MYDCIVIGGGIIGSAAAYHLAKNGKDTLLLDQFLLPHTRGSSHGPARVIRSSYDDPLYPRMVAEAYQLWHQLERETDTTLITKAGMLIIDSPPFDQLNQLIRCNQRVDVACEELSRGEVCRRYPGLLDIPEGYRAVLESEAGVLKADKALECYRTQIRRFGGKIRDGEKVVTIIPGRTVLVRTEVGEYRAKSLILAPGTWINKLLRPLGLNLPINVVRLTLPFWKEPTAGQSRGYPIFLDLSTAKLKHLTSHSYVYGFPSLEYPGLRKIGVHHGVPTDPDTRDACDEDGDLEFLREYVKKHLPDHDDKPAILENCMYSLTPDEDFIIDTLPHHPNISFGCGFSGHGFKMAPVTGRILVELALGQQPSYDISPLRMKRFPGVHCQAKY